MEGLQGKNVLVTGASTGIGRAIAVHFARQGANVAVNYYSSLDEAEVTEDQIESACGEMRSCGVKVLLVQANVAKEEDVTRMFKTAIDALGSIDILINNAGIQKEQSFHDMEAEQFDRVLGVNLRGAFLCAREAIRHWRDRSYPGSITNISSVHEIIPRPQYASYSVSKGGMGNLTRTLALEYAEQGIRVNAIGPGATVTPINDDWIHDPEKQAEIANHIPMRRVGKPEEMAAVTAFLASDHAAYITGQTLYVDGGLTLYRDFQQPWG